MLAETSSLLAADLKHIWHPFTQMQTAAPPLPITRGEGSLLFDDQGNSYIDGISSWWVNIHGHAHPYIAQKVYEQLKQLEHVIFAGFTHQPAVDIASRLLPKLPGKQNRVFFSDNGSTAVEVAIKMCLQYFYNQGNHKTHIVAFEDAYHGDTFGAMSAGARSPFNAPFNPLLFEVIHIPIPEEGKEQESLTALQQAIENHEVCAFIFEPLVQGAGGMNMYEPAALDALVGYCQANGVLCIADEVMTGFGRTGRTFASEYLTNAPDLFCLSKGLTGGTLPLSITTCTEKIFEAFLSNDPMKTFFHGHSFTANPVGCAAALASMDLLEHPDCQANIQRVSQRQAEFAQSLQQHSNVRRIRQRGTITAMDIETGSATSYFNSVKKSVAPFFLERGILLRPLGNVLYVMPPYCTSDDQLNHIYAAVHEFLGSLAQKA